MNGAQTFRRPSTQSRDNLQPSSTSSSGPYIPPHMNQQTGTVRNGVPNDTRYGKSELLNIYQTQKDAGYLGRNLNLYFTGPWDAAVSQNALGTRGDSKDLTIGPEVCWNAQPENEPFGLVEMSESERQVGCMVKSSMVLMLIRVTDFHNFSKCSYKAERCQRRIHRNTRGSKDIALWGLYRITIRNSTTRCTSPRT